MDEIFFKVIYEYEVIQELNYKLIFPKHSSYSISQFFQILEKRKCTV